MKRRTAAQHFAAVLATLLLASLPPEAASAQSRTTAALRGTVTDPAGSPIAGAVVEVRHTGTGALRSALTSSQGRFLLFVLQPGGPYTVSVTHIGFAPSEETGILLQVGTTGTVDIVLQEEAIEVEGVTVEVARPEVFDASRIGPVTRLDERTVESLPILSRSFTDLAVVSPLVTRTPEGGFSIMGQNDRYNAVLVDGLSSRDAFGLTAAGTPGAQAGAKIIPMDAVSQFEVLVAPFDVRLSTFAGGVMNAVTRSGTNDWRIRGFAVGRHESLTGDLYLPTGTVDASGVDRSLLGLSAGGPIIRDKAHFFVAAEMEERHAPPAGYNLFRDPEVLARVSEESILEFQEDMESLFGLETGLAGPYELEQSLSNVFARLDWNFDGGHRLTARHVFAAADNDEAPNREVFQPYELSSNGVYRSSTRHHTAIQLFSDFGSRGGNELSLELDHTVDATDPFTDYPQVEVDLVSSVDGSAYRREVRIGSEFHAQDNYLRQTTLRATDAVTLVTGNKTLTFGLSAAYYDIAHRYLPGRRGSWYFADPPDLEINAPERFQRTVLRDGQPDAVNISVLEFGLFGQTEVDLGQGMTLRAGLRADIPFTLDTPEENAEILSLFEKSTANVPSGAPLLSPRIGFNWQTDGRRRTQIRAGAGVFTGQIPFVWLFNAFHYNGLRSVTQVCQGRWNIEPRPINAAPMFDPANPPDACYSTDFLELRDIVVFDQGFKYPQNFRFTAGVDRELTDDITASVGFMFNHAVNQVSVENINLGQPTEEIDSLPGYGGYLRYYYGNPGVDGYVPVRKHPEYQQVLVVNNEGTDWAYSLTAQLRGRMGEQGGFNLGYTWARSWDEMSLVHTDMVSNYGFNPIKADPNNPSHTTSNFDRPHRMVASVHGTPIPGLEDTEIAVLYTGQSGLPFSYVYQSDMNGDGFPGLGSAFDRYNDLIHVPAAQGSSGPVPATLATAQLLANALEVDPCLSSVKGGYIMIRNSCRAPFQHRLDLRVAHGVWVGGTEIRLEADVINLLNLMNSEWGRINTIDPVLTLLEPFRRTRDGNFLSRWGGGVLPTRDDEGKLVPSLPWTVATPDSQWQAQFGLRVTFGGRR